MGSAHRTQIFLHLIHGCLSKIKGEILVNFAGIIRQANHINIASAERAFLEERFGDSGVSLHLLKPFSGHTVGASGLLESAVLLDFMSRGELPPNYPNTTGIRGMSTPSESLSCGGPVFKLAHGMGGHNALAVFQTEP